MTRAQIVCLIFTTLTVFGFGLTAGKEGDPMPLWQFYGYCILITLGFWGAFS